MSTTTLDPPEYTRYEEKLPEYAFPATFLVGESTPPALVNISQIKNHLALLKAFAELKERVEAASPEESKSDLYCANAPTDAARRWGWFVGLAVERFERWVLSLTLESEELPPIDVAMVWHAYMLNPGWYKEDCSRIRDLAPLKKLEGGLLTRTQELLDRPTAERIESWISSTSTSFNSLPPFDCPSGLRDYQSLLVLKSITCPKCDTPTPTPYINDEGTGYLQEGFKLSCSNCSTVIDKDLLGLKKLLDDLVYHFRGRSTRMYLAGTLLTPHDDADLVRAEAINNKIIDKLTEGIEPTMSYALNRDIKVPDPRWRYAIEKKCSWDLRKLKDRIGGAISSFKMLIGRIMSAYTDEKLFSVHLASAVLRQGSFIQKMHDLKWTDPSYFRSAEDEVALQHAIARYHAFLDLLAASPASFCVPTLDIDLAWHTHQLMGKKYATDLKATVGRFVDHDDKIEESKLSSSFDLTCRAWKQRFGVRYSYCGCPMPGNTIGQRLARFVSSHQPPPASPRSYLDPPYSPGTSADLLAATHPSDHNSVYNLRRREAVEAARKLREIKRKERSAEEYKKLEKKGDTFTPIETDAIHRNGMGAHGAAFLLPVPLFAYAALTCASVSGAMISGGETGVGACGVGGTVCGGGGSCAGAGGCSGGCGGGGAGGCGGGAGGCGG